MALQHKMFYNKNFIAAPCPQHLTSIILCAKSKGIVFIIVLRAAQREVQNPLSEIELVEFYITLIAVPVYNNVPVLNV